jgi:hypothetical protein
MERKELVKLLGEHFGVIPKYMGVPSFAYQIKTREGKVFTINREGKIINEEGIEVEFERLLNGREEEIAKEEFRTEEATLSMDGHTGVTLRNIVNMINSKQNLIKKALKLETDIVTPEFVEGINSVSILTIEHFKASVEDIGIEKAPGIWFDFQKKTISFDFIRTFEDTEVAIQFVKALNESAKKLKQASPKPTETDNEKFTFRTWLVRLGFVGFEYKKAREVLLNNFKGNGAFRKGKPSSQ